MLIDGFIKNLCFLNYFYLVRGVEILAKTPVAVMGALISTLEENREVSFQSSQAWGRTFENRIIIWKIKNLLGEKMSFFELLPSNYGGLFADLY